MRREHGLNIDIYLRKSRKDIEEEKKQSKNNSTYDTLSRHRTQLLALAKKENHNILMIHEEVVSGESIQERPEIQKLIRRMESRLIEAVLVIDIDRLGRGDMLDQGLLDRAFRYSETKLITLTETYDPNDESWELVFGIKSLVARQELKAITRRLQNGRLNSTKEGKSISKKPPYGYKRDENLKLHPDTNTAWIVKKIFQMMVDGKGRKAIAEELDKLCITPPNPERKNWSPSTITALIKNEAYIGHIIWGKIKYVKRNGKYEKRKVPKDQWNITYNSHEPIVSEELFQQANLSHTGRFRPSTVKNNTLSNPLAGILKCHFCGKTMLLQPRKDRPNDVIRCPSAECKTKQKGALFNLVEERLLDFLQEYIENFETNDFDKIESNDNVVSIENAIKKKQIEKDKFQFQKNNLHDLLESKVYSIDTFLERQQLLKASIGKIDEEILSLNNELEIEDKRRKESNEIIPKMINVIGEYRSTDNIEKKNQLLKSVLEKVTYLRTKDMTKKDQFELDIYLRS